MIWSNHCDDPLTTHICNIATVLQFSLFLLILLVVLVIVYRYEPTSAWQAMWQKNCLFNLMCRVEPTLIICTQ